MKKAINLNMLYSSTLLTILIAYVTPCRYVDELKKVFGYPCGWFTVFNDKIGTVILKTTLVNPIAFVMDVIIVYLITFLIHWLYIRSRKALTDGGGEI